MGSNYYDQVNQQVQQAYNEYMFLYYVIPIVVIAFVFGVIALHLFVTAQKTRKRQFEINRSSIATLKKAGFTVTSTFYFSDRATFNKGNEYKKMLAVDNEHKKFALVNYSTGKVVISPYEKFLSYEIYENSNMVISGSAVGGLGFGFFAGAASGQCKDLRLIMRLKSTTVPQVAYDVLPRTFLNIGIHKDSKAYRDCLDSLQRMVSFFEVIKNQNEKTA